MADLGEVLASRLAAEDERSRRQRQFCEEQRQWLLSKLISVSHNTCDNGMRKPQEDSLQRSDGVSCDVGLSVEDRLLEYGRLRAERMEKARKACQEAKEREDMQHLQAARMASQKKRRHVPSLPASAEELAYRRAREHGRIRAASMAELRFQPLISMESVRLAHQRRVKENINTLPIVETLMYRKARADERMRQRKVELSALHMAAPVITERAKRMPLPLTATKRLYLHAKERQNAEREMGKRFHGVVEDSPELTFHPSISEKALQLQRKPGRQAHEDLYEYGVWQQQQRSATDEEEGSSFHPSINRVSKLIAARMNESATERLLRPRVVQHAETPPPKTRLRRDSLDRRFSKLYLSAGTRAARRRSLALEEKELGPECTFAPRINRSRSAIITGGSVAALPLDVRMQLWLERRNQKLEAARRDVEVVESGRVRSTTPRQPVRCVTNKDTAWSSTSVLDNSTAVIADPAVHFVSDGAPEATRPTELSETILRALQALENAERVSQYIMVD